MFQSKRPVLLLIVGLLLLSLFGATVAAQQPTVIRLGLLTAADSPAGRGVQLAIAEINGSGGIVGPDGTVYAIELLSTPATTADGVRAGLAALVERDVLAILGLDDNVIALETLGDLRALNRPVFTGATNDTLTITDTSDFVFRIRAPEQTYMRAVANYLVNLLGRPGVAIVHDGRPDVTESIVGFSAALSSSGVAPLTTLQIGDAATLEGTASALVGANPQVVAVWSGPEAAVTLLRLLRQAGWSGAYFYRHATDLAFREMLTPNDAGGVLGVTNWTPGARSAASDTFLRTYVTTFGSVPDGLSAAYYDAIYLLAAAINQGGGSPTAIQQALQGMAERAGVQGPLNPGQFRIGETTTAAVIVELNAYAAPQVLMRFVNGQLVENVAEPGAPVVQPPGQPAATGTPTPTPTLTPTSTPEGVYGIVTSFRLNVRSGPGTNYDIIGQLEIDNTVFPIGANQDFTWLVIPFRGTTGWIAAYLVEMYGNLNTLPIIPAPPSPTPAFTATPTIPPITATPTPVPFADLVVTAATMEPSSPQPGQPFNVRATVRNQGAIASVETALASSFQPGEVYTSAVIPPLAPGQAVDVTLTATVNGTGSYTVVLVTDLNNVVNEGPNGENNNLFPVSYTLDRVVLAAGTHALAPGQSHDLEGGATNDIAWDGANLTAIGSATIAVLPGLNWNSLHYDQLTGITGTSIPRASLVPGTVVGVITTPEGRRGALRIDSYDGDTLFYTHRVYGP